MPDLIARIRTQLDARIRELRPLARELERLERAASALARDGARSVPGLRSRVAPRTTPPPADRGTAKKRQAGPSPAKPKAARATPPRRKPAPRGQTQEKVLEALAAAPGSTSAAVAKAAGISPSVAAATISRLVKQGRVRRLDQGGYTVVEPPADEPPAAAAETGSGTRAVAQPSAVQPPRRSA